MEPEATMWLDGRKVASILADIYDCLNALRYQHAMANRDPKKQKPTEPEPYPRPGAESRSKSFGQDPIPISEFDEWWEAH